MGRMETDRVLVETSILLRHLRQKDKEISIFRKAVRKYRLFLSVITVYEIEFGAVRAGRVSDLTPILPSVEILSIDQEVARKSAEIHADLISRNQDIGIKDVLIAATCLVNNLPVLTLNIDHYSRVSGLKMIDPSIFDAKT